MNQVLLFSKKLNFAVSISLVSTFFLSGHLTAFSANPVNTTQDGRIINGGTYYNTPEGKTTFINNGSGGLWIRPGVTVRGLEVTPAQQLTNNGGTLHFYAPGSVVRIDGNINVNGILNKNGAYLGNGGKVFIDSAYLFHNGNIFANGSNGGLVQMNVGGMTMGWGASIQAKGNPGSGGTVAVNSSGPVDVRRAALIDTSGRVAGSFDTNLINIEGSLVNVEGILRSDGLAQGSRGGLVRLVATGQSDMAEIQQALASGGQSNPGDPISAPTIDSSTRQALVDRNNILSQQWDGNVQIGPRLVDASGHLWGGLVSANGASGTAAGNNDMSQHTMPAAGDGGSVILAARNDIFNAGLVRANGGTGAEGPSPIEGGNGGLVALLANHNVVVGQVQNRLPGKLEANGGTGGKLVQSAALADTTADRGANGGFGGLIAISYNQDMLNRGILSVNGGLGGSGGEISSPQQISHGGSGGQGGLFVFSGNGNPAGSGHVEAYGGHGGTGGTLKLNGLPSVQLGMDGKGGEIGGVVTPNPDTFLQYSQGACQANGTTGDSQTTGPFMQATRENELLTHADSLILLTRNVNQSERFGRLDERIQEAQPGMRSVTDPLGEGNGSQEFQAKMNIDGNYSYRHFIIGSSSDQLGLFLRRPFSFDDAGFGSGFAIRTMTIVNDGRVDIPQFWRASGQDGGRVSILATGDINNGEDGLDVLGRSSAGSINLASQESIGNFTFLTTTTATGGLHGGSLMMTADQNIENFSSRLIRTDSNLIGGTQRYRAGNDFINTGIITSNARAESSDSLITGGSIYVKANQYIQNGSEDPFELSSLESTATAGTHGTGGFIQLNAENMQLAPDSIKVDGSFENGSVILQDAN